MDNEMDFLKDYIFSGMDTEGLTDNDTELMEYLYGDDDLIPGDMIEWEYSSEGDDYIFPATDPVGFANETVLLTSVNGKLTRRIRPLTPQEINILKPVFGDQLEYDRIRVQIEGIFTIGNISRGVFNRICIDEIDLDANGEIDNDVLIHEAAHVWQYQRTMKWTYAPKAIWEHVKVGSSGGIYDPYIYDHLEGKVPWDEWNPEAQARWIQKNSKLPPPEILNPGR